MTNSQILTLVISTLGGGAAASLVTQILKKLGIKLNVIEKEADTVIHTLSLAVSGVATVAQYVIVLSAKVNPEVLGISGPAIHGVSQAVFKYAQAATKLLGKFQLVNKKAEAVTSSVTGTATDTPAATTAYSDLSATASPSSAEPTF